MCRPFIIHRRHVTFSSVHSVPLSSTLLCSFTLCSLPSSLLTPPACIRFSLESEDENSKAPKAVLKSQSVNLCRKHTSSSHNTGSHSHTHKTPWLWYERSFLFWLIYLGSHIFTAFGLFKYKSFLELVNQMVCVYDLAKWDISSRVIYRLSLNI